MPTMNAAQKVAAFANNAAIKALLEPIYGAKKVSVRTCLAGSICGQVSVTIKGAGPCETDYYLYQVKRREIESLVLAAGLTLQRHTWSDHQLYCLEVRFTERVRTEGLNPVEVAAHEAERLRYLAGR